MVTTAYFTGIKIPTTLTEAKIQLESNSFHISNPMLEERVFILNQRAMELTKALVQFKSKLLSDVLSCQIFTVNYSLLIDHIMREANHFLRLLKIFKGKF